MTLWPFAYAAVACFTSATVALIYGQHGDRYRVKATLFGLAWPAFWLFATGGVIILTVREHGPGVRRWFQRKRRRPVLVPVSYRDFVEAPPSKRVKK